MADLNRIEVTSENQLKEPAAWSVEWHRPSLWGSYALCLTRDRCFDFVLLMHTHKTFGHPEILMALLNTSMFARICWFWWLSIHSFFGGQKKGMRRVLKQALYFPLASPKETGLGKLLREHVTKGLPAMSCCLLNYRDVNSLAMLSASCVHY